MANIPETGQYYTLDLAALYQAKLAAGATDGANKAFCEYGYIINEGEYYDFHDEYDLLACLNNEGVQVCGIESNGSVTLKNDNGENNAYFVLSAEEFEIAAI